jgi:hypothetical protein
VGVGGAGMNIHLHVDRVVLAGVPVPAGQRAALIRALEHELTAQLTARLPHRWRSGDVALAALGPVQVRLPGPAGPVAGSSAPATARGIAHGITRSLTAVAGGRP